MAARDAARVRRLGQREFIDIGEHHVTGVMLIRYHDEILMEAVGQPAAFSTCGVDVSRICSGRVASRILAGSS